MATGCSHVTPTLPRLRKSDRRIFHTKASLQKLSAKVSGAGGPAESPGSGDAGGHGVAPPAPSPSPALPVPAVLGAAGRAVEAARGGAERVRLCPGLCHSPPGALPARGAARRDAGRTCPHPATSPPRQGPAPGSSSVQRGGFRQGGGRAGGAWWVRAGPQGTWAVLGGGFPPAFFQALDGDLYERLREHLSVASRTEVETCRATRDWFQGVAEASARVTAPVPGAGGQEGTGEPPSLTACPCRRYAGSRTSSSSCRTTLPSPWPPSSTCSSPGWRR